jgi:hypothetical protein
MNTGKAVFAQLMDFAPRYEFNKCVARYGGDYKVKEFSCWDQFLSMSFAQLAYRESLRETVVVLASSGRQLYHMGIRAKPCLNTLANANKMRDWRIFQDFALVLIRRELAAVQETALAPALDLKEAVYALDSTTIDLCLSLFAWARFRKRKGAVKMHTLLDVRSSMPCVVYISDGKLHDVHMLDLLELEAGAIYVMDRGYLDFRRLFRFNVALAFFVTRAKRNLDFKCLKSQPVETGSGVLSDMTIELQGVKSRELYPQPLRRVRFKDAETKRIFVFLTNNFTLPAKSIAFLYKCRWCVEVFFRWVKQNLRVKSFFGTSPNAVKTQLWIAMAVYALVVSMRRQLGLKQSPGLLLQILGVHLFEKIPLQEILTENQNEFSKGDICNQLWLFN